MAKAGTEYMEIVGAVQQAMDRGAKVTTGDWIPTKYGRRDRDVYVVGAVNGNPHTVLIECKDWSDPVGIAVVEQLDSKRRHSVKADAVLICSNSGFTKPAILLATDLGIGLISALKAGDDRIRYTALTEYVAKRLSVESWTLWTEADPGVPIPDPRQVLFRGLPVVNWFSPISKALIQQHEDAKLIQVIYPLKGKHGFTVSGSDFLLEKIGFVLRCKKSWYSQHVRLDVTLGEYDHLKRCVRIPSRQGCWIGPFDRDEWKETKSTWMNPEEMEPSSLTFFITLLNHIPPISDVATPPMDAVINGGTIFRE